MAKSVGMFQRPVGIYTKAKILRMPQLEWGYYGASYNYTRAFSELWGMDVSCMDCSLDASEINKTLCNFFSYYEIYPAPSDISSASWVISPDFRISEGWILDQYLNYCTQVGTYKRDQKNVAVNDYVYSTMIKDFFVGFIEAKEKIIVDEFFIYIIPFYFSNQVSIESANNSGLQFYNSIYEAYSFQVFDYAKK